MATRVMAAVVLLGLALSWGYPAARAEAPAAQDKAAAHAAEHGSGEGGGGAGLNPITFHGVNFMGDLTIWTAVVFLVVLLVLAKFAWGPISQGLSKREQEIAAQIAEAQQNNEEARQLLADYQRKLAAAQDEVRGLLEQAQRDAEQRGHELLDKAKDDAAVERKRAVQQIETATAAALKELAERSATLAVELAGRIVHARLDPQDHSRLIQEAVTAFTNQGNGKH